MQDRAAEPRCGCDSPRAVKRSSGDQPGRADLRSPRWNVQIPRGRCPDRRSHCRVHPQAVLRAEGRRGASCRRCVAGCRVPGGESVLIRVGTVTLRSSRPIADLPRPAAVQVGARRRDLVGRPGVGLGGDRAAHSAASCCWTGVPRDCRSPGRLMSRRSRFAAGHRRRLHSDGGAGPDQPQSDLANAGDRSAIRSPAVAHRATLPHAVRGPSFLHAPGR